METGRVNNRLMIYSASCTKAVGLCVRLNAEAFNCCYCLLFYYCPFPAATHTCPCLIQPGCYQNRTQ